MRKQIGVQATPGATLAAATILSLPLGSIYAFSVLLAPLEQLLHASRADLVSVFGVSAVFFTIGANLGPLLFGRHPARLSRPRLVGSSSATGCCSRLAAAWLTSAAVRECCAARPVWPRGYLVSLFPLGAMLARTRLWSGARLARSASNACRPGGRGRRNGICGGPAVRGVALVKRRTASEPTGVQDSLRATFWFGTFLVSPWNPTGPISRVGTRKRLLRKGLRIPLRGAK